MLAINMNGLSREETKGGGGKRKIFDTRGGHIFVSKDRRRNSWGGTGENDGGKTKSFTG